MDSEAFYTANDEISATAAIAALEATRKMGLASVVELPKAVTTLGDKIRRRYAKERDQLLAVFADRLPAVVALALQTYWLAGHQISIWYKLSIERGLVANTESMRARTDPKTATNAEGIAWVLYGRMLDLDRKALDALSADLGLPEYPAEDLLLRAFALYMITTAERELGRGSEFDALAEAFDAFELAHGHVMWDGGSETAQVEASSRVRRSLALTAAQARVAKDPRTAARLSIHEKWLAWQDQRAHLYANQAEFSRQMVQEFTAVTDTRTVENWCRQWKRARSLPAGSVS